MWPRYGGSSKPIMRPWARSSPPPTPCISWEQRRDGLRRKVCGGSLRTDLARDPGTGEYVGYCITSLTGDHKGEIESIYVDPDHRSRGIGDALMRRALQWLDDGGAKVKTLGVAAGNEVVFGFYRRYGFVPRATILQQIPEVQS